MEASGLPKEAVVQRLLEVIEDDIIPVTTWAPKEYIYRDPLAARVDMALVLLRKESDEQGCNNCSIVAEVAAVSQSLYNIHIYISTSSKKWHKVFVFPRGPRSMAHRRGHTPDFTQLEQWTPLVFCATRARPRSYGRCVDFSNETCIRTEGKLGNILIFLWLLSVMGTRIVWDGQEADDEDHCGRGDWWNLMTSEAK